MRVVSSFCHAIAVTVLAGLFAAALATSLTAQQARPLAAGQWVRVDTSAQAERIRGEFLSADPISIRIDPDGPARPLAIARASVRSLEVRTSMSGAGTGALAGFLIGAATGAGVGAYMLLSGWDGGDAMGAMVVFGCALGGAGSLLGSMVGLASQPERWAPANLPPPPTP